MNKYKNITVPTDGEKIEFKGGKLSVPNRPIIPYFPGDGTGPDIWKATQHVIDSAVEKAYGGKKKIAWMEVSAGLTALQRYDKNTVLPQETLDAFEEFHVAPKDTSLG